MGFIMKVLIVWWALFVLSVAGLSAASDLRLIKAAENGDGEAVRSLLKQHVDINTSQADGATALSWAVYRDDLELAELLIGAGANVNAANAYGATPLFLACDNGSSAIVQALLKAGADPNAAAWAGTTVLMRCARTGSVDAVKSLLTRGANVNVKETRQGHTALMWAVAQRHEQVVRMLIERGSDVHARSKGGFTPLLFAAQQGDMDSARLLLEAGANVNETTPEGDTPLLVASLSGHEALSIFFLDKGANPNAAERNGITALHCAMLTGLVRVSGINQNRPFAPYMFRPHMVGLIKALLSHGANPNARLVLPTPFSDSGPGYGKILRIDTPFGGSVSPVGATPFLMAAITYDADLMRLLVASGADPLLATEENVTPLMAAAGLARQRAIAIAFALTEEEERSILEAVKLALELGADVNAADIAGLTALHAAALGGADTVIQFLVEKGANVNAKDKAGQTPLHKALNIKPAGAVARNVNPYLYRKSTADLLLKLGATPVNASVAQRSDVESGSATTTK